MLSRFRTDQEAAARSSQRLAEGDGRHRHRHAPPAQKDVEFKDLGLVVIDEEQRFGVAHKERLKQLRQEVDVLTLTATPIPRTLHMSLAGIRDMSIIETPPEDRLPIRTYVIESDDQHRSARRSLRELERGGQVFFVHNRVHNIERDGRRSCASSCPRRASASATARWTRTSSSRRCSTSPHGEIDVLVCTTIIESGLDIPNANTIFINHADRFGLAQLYQLRGRVGRGAEPRLRLPALRQATAR